MKSDFHQYSYNDSLLMAVPAVHHQTAFAGQVHRICNSPQHRPDAIAVELGHPLVVELVDFLKELRQGSAEKSILPCMMGIMMRNRYLHPDHKEKALLLQEFYRKPLYDLPDDVLSERLHFSKWGTLFLSPADSIIEAVRCAIELDIPVYGVDLSDTPNTEKGRYSLEDPQSAHTDAVEYGNRIMKYCSAGRDLRIDFNRENFMAAGLKHCLSNHKKVLFTCGIAHWTSIVPLLDNELLLPYPVHEIAENTDFRRAIIHPSLAVSVMEIIPQITFEYEKRRFPVTAAKRNTSQVKPDKFVRKCLDSAYRKYASDKKSRSFNLSGSERWSNIGIYEQYLFHLSAVKQRKIPDASTMLAAAEVMMDEDFCRLLTTQIMKVKPDWVSPNDFPDLPTVGQAARSRNRSGKQSAFRKVKIRAKSADGKDKSDFGEDGFYIEMPDNASGTSPDIDKYWDWNKQKKEETNGRGFGHIWIWPPCESLIYGIAFRAAEISNSNQKRFCKSGPFDGSLEGGVDIKETIRSIIRGEKKIYVSKLASQQEQSILDGTKPDPFVLLFPQNTDIARAQWGFFTAGSELDEFVKNKPLLNRITSEQGRVFVSSISIEEKVQPPPHLQSLVYEVTKTVGTVMFGNPCINARQSAIWIETADYKCCPIIFGHSMELIIEYYKKNFNLEIDWVDWQETLIRLAIPFAKKMVTILADDSFKLSERVRVEAARRRVSLNVVGYSYFSEAQLEEARNRYSIRTLDLAGFIFPPETETLLGQTKDTYFEMLPYVMRKQVGMHENTKGLGNKK